MRSAGIREARQHLTALLDEVRQGREVVLTDRGRPVAVARRVRDRDLPDTHARRIYRRVLRDLGNGEFRRAELSSEGLALHVFAGLVAPSRASRRRLRSMPQR